MRSVKMRNPYEVLEIKENASEEEIKKAYRSWLRSIILTNMEITQGAGRRKDARN